MDAWAVAEKCSKLKDLEAVAYAQNAAVGIAELPRVERNVVISQLIRLASIAVAEANRTTGDDREESHVSHH